jgi:hypothetical protein
MPSKEFEHFGEYIMEKPVFSDKYIIQLKNNLPNFAKLQQEFNELVNLWIREAIEEYER